MTQTAVKFLADLPPDKRPAQRQRNWRAVADALRARPHEQAIIGKVARSMITRLRRGDYQDFRPVSDWEWTIKNLADDPQSTKVILLGTYVGVPKPPVHEDEY